MNKTGLKIVAQAVRDIISVYKVGYEFSGSQLRNDVIKICPLAKNSYHDTILRRMRAVLNNGKRVCVCINHDRSLYKKVASVV